MDTAALHTLFGALSSRRGGESTAIELPGADLAAAHLRCADLQGANLAGARLDGAKLTGANLGGARLDAASLVNADLTGADLRWADLSGALLGGALLAAADLRGAKLPRSFSSAGSLVGARVDPSACTRSGFDEEAILALASAGASFDDIASFPSPLRDALASADAVPESAERSRRPAAPDSRRMEAAPDSRRLEAAPDSRRLEAAPDSRRLEAAPDSRRLEAAPDSRRLEAAPDSRRMEAAWSSQRISAPPESQRMPLATDVPRQGVAASASRRAAGEREPPPGRRPAVSGGPRRAPDAPLLTRPTELRLALAGGVLLLVLAAAVALAKIPPRGLLVAAHAGSVLGAALLTFALPLFGTERDAARSLGARLVLAAFAATLVYGLDPSRLAVFRLRATLASGDAAQRSAAVRLLARSGHRSFDGLDLSGLDLSRADLTQSSFRNARLAGADLSGAALMESTFVTADLTAANLRGADLTGSDAEQATGWELAACDAATELPEEGACMLGHPVRASQPSGDTTARSAREGAAPAGAL
ncbi:pentapeptide repeat-containing protein [Sorangium sp. So ce726]|uniref:pentapeptide repeat-containing protein n=1 Tax=Sorangium sp. So ce726 TaxID=3133319 RepID=UPI003F5EA695